MFKRVLALALPVCVASTVVPGATAHSAAVEAAAKQTLSIISISDHCVDEFDEDVIVYVNEGAKDCKITVRVKGRGTTKSKIALEYYDSEEGWTRTEYKVQTTSTSGRATFTISADFPTDVDSPCYSGDSYSHRFAVATSGRYRSFRSASFEIEYTSADDNPACSGYYDSSEE